MTMVPPEIKSVPLALRLRVKAMLDSKLTVKEIFERLVGPEAGELSGGVDPELVTEALRSLSPEFTLSANPFATSENATTSPPIGDEMPAKSSGVTPDGASQKASPESQTEPAIANDVARLFSLLNLNIGGDNPGIVIQFIGSIRGEGISTVAREFAQICAVHSDRPVLLLDLDLRLDQQFTYFAERRGREKELRRPGSAVGLDVDLGQLVRIDKETLGLGANEHLITAHRVGDTSLYVSRVHPHIRERKLVPQMTRAPTCWMQLRHSIAVTVVDSPPFTESFDGLSVSSLVDQVVLVIEAENTRMPVVAELCDRLATQNAPIAGVVFNKRRFYIPRFIYRWI